jgi:hypothetical protein
MVSVKLAALERERCRSAEADWADVDAEGLVVAADVVGGDVDDR